MMQSFRVEYTVWVDVEETNLQEALTLANDRLSVGKYTEASLNMIFDHDGNEIFNGDN